MTGRGADRRRLVFPCAIALANSAIFLFQVMSARITSPSAFSKIVAVLGVLLIVEAPASSFQVVLSRAVQRRVQADQADGGSSIDIGPLVAAALLSGVAIGAVMVPAVAVLCRFLHISHPLYLLAVYAVPVFLGLVPRGVLAGLGDFRSVSAGLMGGAVIRLFAGTVLLHSGYGVAGAVAAVVIGEMCSTTLLMIVARRRTGTGGTPLEFLWRDGLGEGAAFTGLWLLTGIDIVLARHYLPSVGAGYYGAAAALSQLVMILPGAAAAYLFPRFSGSKGRDRQARIVLVRSLLGVTAASVAVGGMVYGLDRPIIQLIFDSDYLGATSVTGLLLLSAGCLGVVTLLQQFLLGRQQILPAILPWAGVVAFCATTASVHGSATQLAQVMMVTTATTASMMLAVGLHGLRYVPQSLPPVMSPDGEVDLTVVMPYFNPGETLAPNLCRLLTVLEQSPVDFEVVAVSDGSTDGSDLTISDLTDSRLRHVILPHNQGKGAALRAGLEAGRGRYLGFIDADGDLDPQLLESFVALVALYQPDVVIGSKRHPLSDVHYPPLRSVYSVGFQYLVRILFRMNIRDTQTGLKLVRRDVLAAALPRMLEKRFAFDLELLVVAHRLGYRRFLEAPVVLRHQFKSTVSLRSVRNTLIDTIAIFYRLRFLRTYDHPPTEASAQFRISPAFLQGGAQLGQ